MFFYVLYGSFFFLNHIRNIRDYKSEVSPNTLMTKYPSLPSGYRKDRKYTQNYNKNPLYALLCLIWFLLFF